MRKIYALTALALTLNSCKDPEPLTMTVDFEELELASSSYWNGSDLSGGFNSGNIYFPNNYVENGAYWSGFAYSNMKDVTTASYSNQYSCIAGSGAGGSDTYAILYSWASDTMQFNVAEKISNIAFCNSTWAYQVMKNGDSTFAIEKMGGVDGSNPDYFMLVVKGLDESDATIGILDLYLADFDTSRVTSGYVSNAWTNVDLSAWGYISKLVFSFETNVANEYGPLIPTYVCIDDIEGELYSALSD